MKRAEELFDRLKGGGESAIEELIAERETESLFLDFKRSSDNGSGTRLSDIDRNNLAKAISGFGNSEGGVIVWGIDCSADFDGADVARAMMPITNVSRFRSWLEGAVSGCTVPPHSAVEHDIIPTTDGNGYVISCIPHSNSAPHQVVGRLQYFIRAGSSFVPVPHMVLAGMFGRRPQPQVHHNFVVKDGNLVGDSINIQVGVVVRNQGPGIAEDLFLNVWILSTPGDNCQISMAYTDSENWSGIWSFDSHLSLISNAGYRLPPEAQVQPMILNVSITPPIDRNVKIKGIVGSGNGPPFRFLLQNTGTVIQKIYSKFVDSFQSGKMSHDENVNLVVEILGIEESNNQVGE